MNAPELSRVVKLRAIQDGAVLVEASEGERAALARRFGIPAIEKLEAQVTLVPDGQRVEAVGTLDAHIVQACAISGEDFAVHIEESLDFVFVPASNDESAREGEEIELERDELDEIEYQGDGFDLGEAVAQSLALAIDPYAEGPNAADAREKAGIASDETPSGPLAEALAALKKD